CRACRGWPRSWPGRIRTPLWWRNHTISTLDQRAAACESLGLGAHQHLVVRLARGDHREAVLMPLDQAVEDHRAVIADHLEDRIVQILRILALDPLAAEGFGQLHEIGQAFRPRMRIPLAMQELLPLPDHAET